MKTKFIYKDKEYYILGFTKMKCPCTRQWLNAVKYMQLETGLEFVREQKEFYKLFKEIN